MLSHNASHTVLRLAGAAILIFSLVGLYRASVYPKFTLHGHTPWGKDINISTEQNEAHETPEASLAEVPTSENHTDTGDEDDVAATEFTLPQDYFDYKDTMSPGAQWCQKMYGLDYVRSWGENREDMCEDEHSRAPITCRWMQQPANEERDYFCVAEGASFAREDGKFRFGCKPNQKLFEMRRHLGDTGLPFTVEKYFANESHPIDATRRCSSETNGRVAFLIQRELNSNLWHFFWEFFSYMVTVDAMRSTPSTTSDHRTSDPLALSAEDVSNHQIIFLDDKSPGPFYDLWDVFTSKPHMHLNEWSNSAYTQDIECFDRVVIPIPGGGFPTWPGDWSAHSCRESELLDVMRSRVLRHFGIPNTPADWEVKQGGIVVTIVNRTGRRKFTNHETLVEKVRAAYPMVTVNNVDFAAISMREQIEIVHKSNVLVGAHGAALTHTLFLPPNSNLVEIQTPELSYRGFRNLAGLLGHRYFGAQVNSVSDDGDWHYLDSFTIDEERFMMVMDAAIRSEFFRGQGSYIQ